MPPRWNAWTVLHPVRFDYEKATKPRPVRLAHAAMTVGDTIRVGVSGAEVEAIIVAMEGPAVVVSVSRSAIKVKPRKTAKRAG